MRRGAGVEILPVSLASLRRFSHPLQGGCCYLPDCSRKRDFKQWSFSQIFTHQDLDKGVGGGETCLASRTFKKAGLFLSKLKREEKEVLGSSLQLGKNN